MRAKVYSIKNPKNKLFLGFVETEGFEQPTECPKKARKRIFRLLLWQVPFAMLR